jgi:uncharacterized protein YbaP (TraB family)
MMTTRLTRERRQEFQLACIQDGANMQMITERLIAAYLMGEVNLPAILGLDTNKL